MCFSGLCRYRAAGTLHQPPVQPCLSSIAWLLLNPLSFNTNARMRRITTTTFKWKADYLTAEPHFKGAGRAFKAAGAYDQALDALRKAAHCSVKMGNLKQAALTLETAAREWSVLPLPGSAGKEAAATLYAEVSALLLEAGELVRAVDVKLNAGKLYETIGRKEDAAKLYDEAAGMFEGVGDKDVYAVAPLGKVLANQLGVGKFASAMRTLEKLIRLYSRLSQPHNVHRGILSRVVLLLASGDPVAAQREFEAALDMAGFAASDEAGAAEDMIGCYTEMNADALKTVTDRNVINYMDPPIAKIAKGAWHRGTCAASRVTGCPRFTRVTASPGAPRLTQRPPPITTLARPSHPAGLHKAIDGGGNSVGHATPQESASRAVRREDGGIKGDADAGPGGLRAFGATSGGRVGGAYLSEEGDADAGFTAKAKKTADRDATTRATLFSKPAGSGSGGGKRAAAPTAEEEGDAPVFGSGGGDEYDYEKAFADMGVGEQGAEASTEGAADSEEEEEQERPAARAQPPAASSSPPAAAGGDDDDDELDLR